MKKIATQSLLFSLPPAKTNSGSEKKKAKKPKPPVVNVKIKRDKKADYYFDNYAIPDDD